jgi:acyl-CoA thioester hydrolase
MQSIYYYQVKVKETDIDELNHVNNEVYLKWLIEAAATHAQSLGYGLEQFLASGAAFVVRRHELEYLRPAFLGEELIVETWLSTFDQTKSVRETRIKRKKDDQLLLVGKTLWVYIDLKMSRPKEIPATMAESFKQFLHSAE